MTLADVAASAGLVQPQERARLVRLCLQLTGDIDAAEDLAQETLYEAWRHLHAVHDPRGLDRWLSAIARNVCRRWAQRRGRELAHQSPPGAAGTETTPTLENLPPDDFDVEVELERRELVELLDRALALLPPETRATLIQRYVEEMPVGEMAARLGLTEGAVAMRLQRGKLALRRLLCTWFAREAVAFGLIDATDGTWQETRIWCTVCGARRLLGCLDHRQGTLILRCPACDSRPGGHCERTQDPAMFARIKGYRPAYSRVLAVVGAYYTRSLRQNPMPCPSCGHLVRVLPGYPQGWHGVHYRCPRCLHGASSNLEAIVLGLPEGKRFWQDHPRIRRLPPREIEVNGSAARVSTYESVTGHARLEAIATRDTCRLIAIHRSP